MSRNEIARIAFAAEAVRIEKVSVTPKTIDLSKAETATIQFETTRDAFLTVTLRDENMNPIKRLELGLKPKGAQSVSWNGSDEVGAKVKTDVVIYTIDARTEDGQYATYDPAPETGGLDLKFPEFSLDKKTGRDEYVLPKAASVRLRAWLRVGALLRTVFDWKAEEAGRHEFLWDGKDESGEINLLEHPDMNLNLNAFSLPDNAILIQGTEIEYLTPDDIFRGVSTGKHFHYPHPRFTCHEPRFEIRFPGAGSAVMASPERGEALLRRSDASASQRRGIPGAEIASTPPSAASRNDKQPDQATSVITSLPQAGDAIPVPQAKVPFQIVLDPKHEAELLRKRFEVMVYLDLTFLFEEEQAVSPATFYLDLSGVNPGEHLLTVNVMSYDDHIGTKTVKVKVAENAVP
jgi:flagellar hook assembly protein FlgD